MSIQRELRGQRNEAIRSCEVTATGFQQSWRRQWWAVAELDRRGVQLETVVEDLAALVNQSCSNPCAVYFEGQNKPVETTTPGGVTITSPVEVSNPPDVAAVQAAVTEGTETSNQNIWAIAGLVVGFGALAALYKMVRP